MCLSSHLTFAPYTEEAHAFVFATFADSLKQTPSIGSEARRTYEHALKRLLRDPSSKAVVVTPSGQPGELMGWAVAMPDALAFAYVRFAYRRGKLGLHLGSQLIALVAGETAKAAIWTMDASRMAGHGFPIRYDLDAHEQFTALAR